MYFKKEDQHNIYYFRAHCIEEFNKDNQYNVHKIMFADVVIDKKTKQFVKNRFFYNVEGYVESYIENQLGEDICHE
jgi:hypothetical protein